MCGIAGIFAHSGLPPEQARTALAAMRDAQHHRGPDDRGIMWSNTAHAGLAACRLAIRDLSPAGHMPMCIDDVCITYNGEIYNADELRAELLGAGQTFDSHSDTEVILRGYVAWGDAVVTRLRGMFAFGILDGRTQQLLLARDPLGIKPLYYTHSAPFAFASELQALIAAGSVDARIDQTALSAYLQLGSIPAPLTIYQQIAALRPGHIAKIPVADPGKISLRRYWSPPDGVQHTSNLADVKNALQDAVASHLVSDVPVGAFLSGGLDSSTIVALASQMASEPLRTCSIAFESAAHDESPYARAVAQAFGTRHYEHVVTRTEFFHMLPKFFSSMDQPSIDGFNTYLVSAAARQAGLSVAMTGLGGDELFGGYPSFNGVPRLLRALRLARAGGTLPARALAQMTLSDRWRKVAAAVERPVTSASALLVYRGLFTRAEAMRLLPDAQPFDAEQYVAERAGPSSGSVKEWVGRAELATYTTSQLLRDSDVMSMAHSLELRVPLLDTRLVETVHALPSEQRFPANSNKGLLRSIMADRLPAVVMERRHRQGFSFPMQEWLGADLRIHRWDAELLEPFDRNALSDVQQRFQAGYTHWSRYWSLITLSEWSGRAAHA
jgi:asparagine synthase (glutamine-hydrolysing)